MKLPIAGSVKVPSCMAGIQQELLTLVHDSRNVTETQMNKINNIVKKQNIFSFKLPQAKRQFHVRQPNAVHPIGCNVASLGIAGLMTPR